jgi:hypothetical protein
MQLMATCDEIDEMQTPHHVETMKDNCAGQTIAEGI